MKVNFSIKTDITSTVGIWESLITTLEKTDYRTIIVNDKRYFYYIFNAMGINPDLINDAWIKQTVTIPKYGLIHIQRKQTMKNSCRSAILLFPDQDLIHRAENDQVIKEYAVIYDTDELTKIMNGIIVFDDK